MPTYKELEQAWAKHDELESSDSHKDCSQFPGYNKTMGHSHFNPGCKRWASEYAIQHPIERVEAPPTKKVVASKIQCSSCLRLISSGRAIEYKEYPDMVFCSNKCVVRYERKLRYEEQTRLEIERQEKIIAEIKEKGMIEPKKTVVEKNDGPLPDECPECDKFINLDKNGYANVCKGYEPWSCHRTQKEGKCEKSKKVEDTNEKSDNNQFVESNQKK